MPWLQLLTMVMGEGAAGASEEQAKFMLEKAMAEFGKIDAPALQAIAAEELGPSAMEGMRADRGLQGLERESLDQLLKIGRSGGMTLEDKANLNSIRQQSARQAGANNSRVREQMAARGIGGGGAELAMQLSGNQAAAQRASDEGLNVAAQAQKRGMDAILQSGRMAGGMNERDFNQRSQAASAADARARANADARMRAKLYNADLPDRRFRNQLALASGRAGQANNLSGFYSSTAAGQRAAARGYGQAASNMGNSSGGGQPKYDADGYRYESEPEEWENPYGGY